RSLYDLTLICLHNKYLLFLISLAEISNPCFVHVIYFSITSILLQPLGAIKFCRRDCVIRRATRWSLSGPETSLAKPVCPSSKHPCGIALRSPLPSPLD